MSCTFSLLKRARRLRCGNRRRLHRLAPCLSCSRGGHISTASGSCSRMGVARGTPDRFISWSSAPRKATGAREARHDGAHGNASHVGQFPVGQTLQFAQHEQLTKTIRKTAHRPLDQGDVGGVQQQHFRIGPGTSATVLFLIERVGGSGKLPGRQPQQVLRTILRNQAWPLPPLNVRKYRRALSEASCTTSSASCSLRSSHRANRRAASR